MGCISSLSVLKSDSKHSHTPNSSSNSADGGNSYEIYDKLKPHNSFQTNPALQAGSTTNRNGSMSRTPSMNRSGTLSRTPSVLNRRDTATGRESTITEALTNHDRSPQESPLESEMNRNENVNTIQASYVDRSSSAANVQPTHRQLSDRNESDMLTIVPQDMARSNKCIDKLSEHITEEERLHDEQRRSHYYRLGRTFRVSSISSTGRRSSETTLPRSNISSRVQMKAIEDESVNNRIHNSSIDTFTNIVSEPEKIRVSDTYTYSERQQESTTNLEPVPIANGHNIINMDTSLFPSNGSIPISATSTDVQKGPSTDITGRANFVELNTDSNSHNHSQSAHLSHDEVGNIEIVFPSNGPMRDRGLSLRDEIRNSTSLTIPEDQRAHEEMKMKHMEKLGRNFRVNSLTSRPRTRTNSVSRNSSAYSATTATTLYSAISHGSVNSEEICVTAINT